MNDIVYNRMGLLVSNFDWGCLLCIEYHASNLALQRQMMLLHVHGINRFNLGSVRWFVADGSNVCQCE